MRLEHENKKLKSHQKDEQDEQVTITSCFVLIHVIRTIPIVLWSKLGKRENITIYHTNTSSKYLTF